MNGIKKFFAHSLSYKLILILLVVGICALLFPMLLIGKYNIPSADDFSFGVSTHRAVVNGQPLSAILKIAWDQMRSSYYATQGTFSAVFLFTLQPAVFGEDYYALVPYIMLTSLIVGIFVFTNAFFSLFSTEKTRKRILQAIIACVLIVLCTQFLPSPVQGFYWYNGAVYYTFFFGLSLILYGMLIRLAAKKPEEKMILLQIGIIVLCVLIAFCNLITTLTTLIILVSVFCLLIFTKNKNWKFFILPLIIYGICFYINVTAPGFASRQEAFDQRPGVYGTILLSFQYAITQLYQWNTIPVLAFYLFLIPVLWKIASGSGYDFRLPWLVSLFCFCLQASMNAPTYFAYADPGPGRIEDIRFYAMMIMAIINLFYWEGWIAKRLKVRAAGQANGLQLSFLLGVILLCAGGMFLSEKDYPVTSIAAFQSYRSGEAGLYKHIARKRLEVLNDPDVKDASLRGFPKKPYLLYVLDISEDPNEWPNTDVAAYYQKNSVRLMTHEEFEQSVEE